MVTRWPPFGRCGKITRRPLRPNEVNLAGPDALMREATQLHRQNRVPEAIAAYQAIVLQWPQQADAWFNLAVLHRQVHQLGDALHAYQRALDAGISRPEEVHLNRAVIYTDYLRQHAAAAKELELALTVNPGYVPALLNLANLYEDLGNRTEASGLYARILHNDPRNFEALARFANVQPKTSVDEALIAKLQAALASPSASAAERASLGFALGRLLDFEQRYAPAFAAYTLGNQASLAAAGPHVVRYDRHQQHAFIDRLIAGGIARHPATATPQASPQPVFVCGMFRSGSTLVEQYLSRFEGVSAGGELDFIPRFVHTEMVPFFDALAGWPSTRFDAAVARYRDELKSIAPQARYVTDKRPDNFLNIGLIKSMFPNAKIVHTTRDPLDNCLSIYFLHLDQQMSYALNLLDIGHYFREYRRLMAHWKQQFGADILDFSYDAFIADPEASMARLCEFLGLEWTGKIPEHKATEEAIKTASVWQVREPLYKTSSGRAQHYAAELQPLRDYLADLL
jgi:tetratricopeptide (TPR) repeat protein